MFLAALHIPQLHICINASISTKKWLSSTLGYFLELVILTIMRVRKKKELKERKLKWKYVLKYLGFKKNYHVK
jgi:hypothetical protein